MKISNKVKTIEFDSQDYNGMLELMKDCDDSEFPFMGRIKIMKLWNFTFLKIKL